MIRMREGRDGCPFCDPEVKAKALMHRHEGYVLEPLNPVTEGHLLIIPRAHRRNNSALQLGYGMESAARILREFFWSSNEGLDQYNLILNGGEHASQTVEHMHWHYVPRREGDGLQLPWTGQHA